MKLGKISDEQLLKMTKQIVMEERSLIASVVEHLREIETRKLYCDLRYYSLHDYCCNELGYSSDQAYRRISAMKLSRQIPKVVEYMDRGTLTLSNVNKLGSLFNNLSDLTKKEQIIILDKIDGKNRRECDKIIEEILQEKGISPVRGNDQVRLNLMVSKETARKIEKLKALYGYKKEELDRMLSEMADTLIEKKEAEMMPKRRSKKITKGRYISKEVKHKVYKRSKGKCELCGSVYALEYDHISPHSCAGSNELKNIRLY